MNTGSRITFFDDRPEKVIRKSLWRQWTIVITLLAWIMWFVTDHYNGKSILVPILVTLIGVGAGWLFGYKLGFGPVFSGVYFFGAERVIEPTDKSHKAVCPRCNSGNCEVRSSGRGFTTVSCPSCGYNIQEFTGFGKI